MPTPTGQIGLSDVNVELGKSSSALITKNDTNVRQLANLITPFSQISMNDLRGKSFDTTGPVVTISASSTSLAIGQTSTVYFTLSESSSNFIAADVSVSAGSISNFSGSGASYSATYTPPNGSTGSATISVPANRLTDALGNQNTASNNLNINYDTQAPTISISASSTSLVAGQTSTITFTLSESSNNFTSGDVSVSDGSISNFSGSGASYSATYTPPSNTNSSANISVASSTFTDGFGNSNSASNTITISYNTVVDSTAPSISINASSTNLSVGQTSTITFTLTEGSFNFTSGDVSVSAGSLTGFSGSNTSYSATYTPPSNSNSSATISVAAGAFTDSAGNGNNASNVLTIFYNTTVDTTPPTINISTNNSNLSTGQTATITFTLSEFSSTFTIGDVNITSGSLAGFSGSGTSYTATYTPPANSSGSTTVSVAANLFTDAAGNGNTASNNLNINYNTVTGGGGGVSIINPLGFNGQTYQDYQPDIGYANTTLNLNRNGTWSVQDSTTYVLASGNWANSPSSTIGDTVYVRFTRTVNSNSATGGSSASTGWQQLNTDRSVFVYEATPNTWLVTSQSTYTVELSNSASGSPVASTSSIVLQATTNTYGGGIEQ